MASRDLEARPQRWPAALLIAGVASLLPQPAVREALSVLEGGLLTARRLVDPMAWRRVAQAAQPPAGGPDRSPDRFIVELLATARARVIPDSSEGWQRDGRFCGVTLGRVRSPSSLSVASAGPLPPGEPAFHGRELVGFTSSSASDDRPRIVPLRAKGTRLSACAGAPGKREARFLALGDGSELLRVAYADRDVAIEEGDLAWAIDPLAPTGGAVTRIVGGALLGRIVRGDAPRGSDRDDWRVAPLTPLAELAELAIRHPPGFPGPSEASFVPLAAEARHEALVDARRDGLLLPKGRESGVVEGCAVSAGPWWIGRVVRAGWGASIVRTVRDPGLTCPVLVISRGEIRAFALSTAEVRGADVRLEAAPPFADCDGAVVVTAPGPEGVPEGLLVGTLHRDDLGWFLTAGPAAAEAVVVHRPPGAWGERE